jgi:hypothetical protein
MAKVARAYLVDTWTLFLEEFHPDPAAACPTWERLELINPPTVDSVLALEEGDVGKQNALYRVRAQGCDDATCAVERGLECASGFGSELLVESDSGVGTITVDPVYWLVDTEYPDGGNPFHASGYYHRMATYGRAPGAVYGAIQRAGEKCSQWDLANNLIYTNRTLKPVECGTGTGWYCQTICKL